MFLRFVSSPRVLSRSLHRRSTVRRCTSTVACDVPGFVLDEQKFVSRSVSIYFHWPFCRKLCTYCSFNKYTRSLDEQLERRMAKCLVLEAQKLLSLSGARHVASVYIGGGTPSLAQPATIALILDGLARVASLPADSEITLEANPSSADCERLRGYRSAGVNRLSLGVQALDDHVLGAFNRDHTVSEALQTIEQARQLFPGWTNVDFIFGRPGQTLEQWQGELQKVLAICDNHVSLYELTVEGGTKLSRQVASGQVIMPDTDTMADMYQLAVQVIAEHGIPRYEVSNFARPGFESKHNQRYWQGREYIGVGPGAHGRFQYKTTNGLQWHRRVQRPEPNAWMEQVETIGHGTASSKHLSTVERLEQLLATGLRLVDGLTEEVWQSHSGGFTLQEAFQCVNNCPSLPFGRHLCLNKKGLRAKPESLALIDSLVLELALELEKSHSAWQQKEHT